MIFFIIDYLLSCEGAQTPAFVLTSVSWRGVAMQEQQKNSKIVPRLAGLQLVDLS
jgi:hypothetical protein